MSDFYIKQNDTSPSIKVQFLDSDNIPVNITGSVIKFKMTNYNSGENVVDKAAVISDGEDGTAYYLWDAVDTSIAGLFKAEFEVTYTDGYVETFPNDGYITVSIQDDLD